MSHHGQDGGWWKSRIGEGVYKVQRNEKRRTPSEVTEDLKNELESVHVQWKHTEDDIESLNLVADRLYDKIQKLEKKIALRSK